MSPPRAPLLAPCVFTEALGALIPGIPLHDAARRILEDLARNPVDLHTEAHRRVWAWAESWLHAVATESGRMHGRWPAVVRVTSRTGGGYQLAIDRSTLGVALRDAGLSASTGATRDHLRAWRRCGLLAGTGAGTGRRVERYGERRTLLVLSAPAQDAPPPAPQPGRWSTLAAVDPTHAEETDPDAP